MHHASLRQGEVGRSEKLDRKSMVQVIKDVFSDQPDRPKPVLTPVAPQPVVVTEVKRNLRVVQPVSFASPVCSHPA